MVAVTMSVCAARSARGPRRGVEDDAASFCRFAAWLVNERGSRPAGAGGLSALEVDQTPTVWSSEADRMRELGWWTASEEMLALWP